MAFVLDGWIRSWRTSPWAGCVTNDRIFEVTRGAVIDLLERGMKIVVGEVADRLVGFVAYERPDILHYVFVKRRGFRGLGIGRMLVTEAAIDMGLTEPGRFTHRTTQAGWLLSDGWTWDPVPVRTKTA